MGDKELKLEDGETANTPKEREVNRRREACEWEGCACVEDYGVDKDWVIFCF